MTNTLVAFLIMYACIGCAVVQTFRMAVINRRTQAEFSAPERYSAYSVLFALWPITLYRILSRR